MTLTIGSLFSGYGGLDLAVEQVFDAKTVWVSDVDKGTIKILDYRFPDAVNIGDITKVDWSMVFPVDILTGGSPCQDISNAGKRAGMAEGTRSNLWVEMREAIAALRPSYVVWENVNAARSARAASDMEPCTGCVGTTKGKRDPGMRALGRVLGDLASLGYDATWHSVRASDVGAPHRRDRIFVLAYPQGSRRPVGSLAEPSASEGWRLPGTAAPGSLKLLPTPRTTDDTGPCIHGTGGLDLSTAISLLPTPMVTDAKSAAPADATRNSPQLRAISALLPTPAVNDMGAGKTVEAWDEWTEKMRTKHANGNGHGKSLHIEALRLLPTPVSTDGEKGGPNQRSSSGWLPLPSAVQQNWGRYDDAIARWEVATGAPAPSPISSVSRAGNDQLSPAFVEWMMGLPCGWVTDVPDLTRREALKALGNGVVPQQAVAALTEMLSWTEPAVDRVWYRPIEDAALAA